MIVFNQLGRYGRICNQLFQIAGTIGTARKMGYDFAFPYWMNYDHKERFGFTEDIDIQRWFKNPLPVINKEFPVFNVKWGYHEISPPDNVSLAGHFQCEKYFLHCEDEIRHYFEFALDDVEVPETAVAIHLRCGDYGGDYHPVCSKEYYRQAMKHFSGPFYVFSDDPEKAKEIIPGCTYIEGNHSMVDLHMMTMFNYHIIANSTFSWWGAWLARSQKTVAPSYWFGPAAKISSKDLYCKGWIVI